MGDIKPYKDFTGIFSIGHGDSLKFYTKNLLPGMDVLSDRLVDSEYGELRSWNPFRSKFIAAVQKGIKSFPLTTNSTVLYLGAANGTTVSHISDICTEGNIFAVEFSPRSTRELVQNCQNRYNVTPILADATRPEEYRYYIHEPVDILYQDVAQPNQAEIFAQNAQWYAKDGATCYLAIKTRSIDTTMAPVQVVKGEIAQLEAAGFQIEEITMIDPYSKDHAFIIATYRRS